MPYKHWRTFTNFAAGHVRYNEQTARICFNSSHTYVADPLRSQRHLTINYIDFLEGVCRLAMTLSEPSDSRPLCLHLQELITQMLVPLLVHSREHPPKLMKHKAK